MEKNLNREPAVNGRFYPNSPLELNSDLQHYFKKHTKQITEGNIQALIVPHAGYIFSGEVAASAFGEIDSTKTFENIFILAPSHSYSINGASIYNIGDFQTPLGVIPVNIELCNKLIAANSVFKSIPEVHTQEHSIEVQLPFLQFHLKNKFQIVPILIGTQNEEYLKQIAETLGPYFNERNLFVISSDFSHYPDYKGALKADSLMKGALLTNKVKQVQEAVLQNKKENVPNLTTSACGISAILTLLYITENYPNIKIEALKYLNSGDSKWGDHQRVVGYWSFAIVNKSEDFDSFQLSVQDKSDMLILARQSIESHLTKHEAFESFTKEFSNNLLAPTGVFVTLHHKNKLRGCIGSFDADEPLYKMVQKMAIAAATKDNRFEKVKADELNQLVIEISVLTPLKRINSKDEIIIGKHGIFIKQGINHGTLLPQVAIEKNWSVDEFLGYCSQNKAGLGWDGWKSAELYVYTAFVFSEE